MVTPCQYDTAMQMLTCKSEGKISGGLLADIMGTGKTFICLVFLLLRALIAYDVIEVQAEWEQRAYEKRSGKKPSPKKHLARDAAADERCPCGNVRGIECHANPGAVTREMWPQMAKGAALLLVSASVISAWIEVLKNGCLNRKYYQPMVFHPGLASREVAPDPNLRSKMKPGIKRTAGATFPPDKPAVTNYEFTSPAIREPGYQLERYIFVTSHNPSLFTSAFEVEAVQSSNKKKPVYCCPIGVQIVDEFHRVMSANNPVVELARQHRHMWKENFHFWAVSGTPLPKGLLDLETSIELLQHEDWEHPEHPQHHSRLSNLRALDAARIAATSTRRSPQHVAAFQSKLREFFKGGLAIRHIKTSKFFDANIFDLQDPKPMKITHYTPDAFYRLLQQSAPQDEGATQQQKEEWEKQEKKKREIFITTKKKVEEATGGKWTEAVRCVPTFDMMLELGILSTFPNALKVMLQGRMDFSAGAVREEIKKAEDRDVEKVPVFRDVLDDVMEGSPKLGTILSLIDAMLRDRTRRPERDDGGGTAGRPAAGEDATRKKMVIICPRLAEAVFVYLAVRRARPGVAAVFFHSGLKASAKAAIKHDFQSLGRRSPQVFVASFGDGGTGLNLFAANYQVQTGPLRLRAHEHQSFGRTNRIGQLLPVQHYLLLTEDNPVDRIVVTAQAGKSFVSDPFDMIAPLVLA